jgi:ATP synthase protein I
MNEKQSKNTPPDKGDRMLRDVEAEIPRKIEARRDNKSTLGFGLATFGMVGWSIAVPTILGIGSGIWLDKHFDRGFSWTLTMLFVGLVLGGINAWYWINRQTERIHEQDSGTDSG